MSDDDPAHLDAGRQLELVARDTRAGDGAHDARLDAEVAEGLFQAPRHRIDRLRRLAEPFAEALQKVRLGHLPGATLGDGEGERRILAVGVLDHSLGEAHLLAFVGLEHRLRR